MARLEEIIRGATVKGVLPDGFVTVVDVSETEKVNSKYWNRANLGV